MWPARTSGVFYCVAILACAGCGGAQIPANPDLARLRQIAQAVVASAIADPDPQVRAAAAEVIASTGQMQLAPALLSLLRDGQVPVRFAALMGIGQMQYTQARAQVQEVFDQIQEDTNVRLAAAYALVRLGASPYAEYPKRMIVSKDQTVRANAAMILGRIADKQSLEALYWAIQDPASDQRVVMQAMESIAMLGDTRIYNRIWTRLISAYADDRIAGIRAMGALGTNQAKEAIMTTLDDEVLEVRLAAAAELGRLGDRSGLKVVKDAMDKGLITTAAIDIGQGRTQGEVAKVLCGSAIGQIGSMELARYLPRLLEDPSRLVQLSAAKAVLQLTR